MPLTLIPQRLEVIRRLGFSVGVHPEPIDSDEPCGACLLEGLAYVTGQKWSDKPEVFCPTIEAALRRVNDVTNQPGRDGLGEWALAHLDGLSDTADDGYGVPRGFAAADGAVRRMLPMWLDLAGAGDVAADLRALPAIVDGATAAAACRAVHAAQRLKMTWTGRSDRASALVWDAISQRVKGLPAAGTAYLAACAAYADEVNGHDPGMATDVAGAYSAVLAAGYGVAAGAVVEADTLANAAASAALADVGTAMATAVADAAADAARDDSLEWAEIHSMVGHRAREHVVALLDQKRVARGMPPAVEVTVELLGRLMGVGHADQAV